MKIGELFVDLGVKGTDHTFNAFKGVKNGLGDIKSMSLEAKAAIVGAIYALQRMMAQSGQTGTNLTNFSELTGLSARSLQQWQYAARQAGVSGEELTGNLKAVQTAMTQMLMGEGAPKGMGLLANTVGFDQTKIQDTFYVMEQLQKFARSNVAKDLQNNVLKSFGLSEGTIAAMRRGVFNQDTFKKAPLYSEGEIKQLDKVNVAWSNLGQKIQMAFGHFTSKHGMQLVDDISKIAMAVIKLTEAFIKLADKMKLFQAISQAIAGWAIIFQKITESMDGKEGKGKGVTSLAKDVGSYLKQLGGEAATWAQEGLASGLNFIDDKITGPVPTIPDRQKTENKNVVVNQNLNFQHEGKEHQKTAQSVKQAVQHAVRTNPAIAGGW